MPPANKFGAAGQLIIHFSDGLKPEAYMQGWGLHLKARTNTATKTPNGIALAQNAAFIASYIDPSRSYSSFNMKAFFVVGG